MPAALLAAFNQLRVVQQRKVLADGRRRQAEQFNDLAEAQLATLKGEQCANAGFVAEGTGDVEIGLYGRLLYFVK